MQLMLIVKTGDDIKAKIEKLLNLWVTTRKDPNWENLIAALQYIGLDNLAKALTDELDEGPSIQGTDVTYCKYVAVSSYQLCTTIAIDLFIYFYQFLSKTKVAQEAGPANVLPTSTN